MIDLASMGDWIRATVMVGVLGGLAAACGWAIREEELAPRSRVTMGRVPVAAAVACAVRAGGAPVRGRKP
ncbi:MAG TPA: hypothetical protein VE776_10975 [Actinomycetota bacterium]|jgi:hypothetical protein|nr:hypothetical protein [Actinomycetota bacterium]